MDPYLTKSEHFEAAREELNKIKGKNDGINAHKHNYNKSKRDKDRREEK